MCEIAPCTLKCALRVNLRGSPGLFRTHSIVPASLQNCPMSSVVIVVLLSPATPAQKNFTAVVLGIVAVSVVPVVWEIIQARKEAASEERS